MLVKLNAGERRALTASNSPLAYPLPPQIRHLERERDWFRREALRLDAYRTAMKKDLRFLKEKCDVLEENRDWFAQQLKTTKRQNKRLLQELKALRRIRGATGDAIFDGADVSLQSSKALKLPMASRSEASL
eukprot:scaffold3038_cov250-Pinguiococcus_pyrenoidosus.AAC.1